MSGPTSNSFHVPDEATLWVVNDLAQIEQAQNQVMTVVERFGYPRAAIFAIRLALHEAVSNSFRHGHAQLPPSVPVQISYRVTPSEVLLTVEDQGPGFEPETVPDPTLEENLERGSGRGLLLIRAYMASAAYSKHGTRLEMKYQRAR